MYVKLLSKYKSVQLHNGRNRDFEVLRTDCGWQPMRPSGPRVCNYVGPNPDWNKTFLTFHRHGRSSLRLSTALA